MLAHLIDDFSVGRYFVLLCSLFNNRPIFEHDLRVHESTMDMQSASSKNEQRILAEDYGTLLEVNRLTRFSRMCQWFYRLFSILSVARCLFYLYEMHYQFKIFSREDRLIVDRRSDEVTSPSAIYSFGCIRSNCSQLFDPQLNATKSELILDRLPIFSMCHPTLSSYYEPLQHEFGVGTTLFSTIIIYLVFIDLLVFKLEPGQTLDNSMLVFLVTPNLAHKSMLERAKQHLKEMRHSYRNYLNSERIKRHCRIECARHDGFGLIGDLPAGHGSKFAPPTLSLIDRMRFKFDHIDETDFARDCLPLIRSRWWHKIMINAIKHLAGIPILYSILIAVSLCCYYEYLANRMRELTHGLHHEMQQENCSIWRLDDHLSQQVDLTGIKLGLNIYTAFTASFIFVLWPCLCGISVITNACFSVWELRCWMCELQYKLTIVQPLIKDLVQWLNGRRKLHDEPNLVFRFDKFRLQFMAEIRPSLLLIRHKSFVRFSKQVENEQKLEENYCRLPYGRAQSDPEYKLAELLEKFYVELRLMIELKGHVERRISMITIGTIVATYLSSLSSVYVIKMMHAVRLESVMVGTMGQLAPMALIMNSVSMSTQVS